jgi:hypothetical protein
MYKGIHSFRYSADFGDMSTDPELKCFCTTPDTCMKKGVHDLTRCSGKTTLIVEEKDLACVRTFVFSYEEILKCC